MTNSVGGGQGPADLVAPGSGRPWAVPGVVVILTPSGAPYASNTWTKQ